MQNKSANRWLDVQIVIATLTLTFSLALWNLFAGGSRPVSTGANLTSQSQSVASPPPASAPLPVASPPPASAPLPQVRIYLGGAAPQSPSIPSAPEPVTNTSSSRP
jgi:hypothetical protein